MKRRTFLRESALLSAGFVVSSWHIVGNYRKPFITKAIEPLSLKKAEIPVLVLEGSPRQRGQVHGEELREKILELVQIWKLGLGRQYWMDPDEYISEFLENTNFPVAIKKWTPGLLEEVKGLAEGSGVDYETMLAYQFVDEEWWYGMHKTWRLPIPDAKHCSALGVYGQEGLPNLVAQNLDIPAYTNGFQALLDIKYKDSSLEALVFTYAGLISLCGMNNHGIGEVVNALLQLDHRVDGLPVAFINRGILEQTNHEEAVQFVKNIKHASGQNYTIGSPEKISAFECSANKVSAFVPYKGAKRMYHTNHPLVNDDQGIHRQFLKKWPERMQPKHPGNSEIRYAALEKRLKDPDKRITFDKVKETLSSRDDPRNPVCRIRRKDGRGAFTSGCLIMELSQSPVLHLSPGPPCTTEFQTFTF